MTTLEQLRAMCESYPPERVREVFDLDLHHFAPNDTSDLARVYAYPEFIAHEGARMVNAVWFIFEYAGEPPRFVCDRSEPELAPKATLEEAEKELLFQIQIEDSLNEPATPPLKHMVITGDPLTGFTFEGPFDSVQNAMTYASQAHDGKAWWIGQVTPPLILTARPEPQ